MAEHLEAAGVVLARGAPERVDRLAHLDLDEPGVGHQLGPLLGRLAAGDAVGPQVDVALRLFRHLPADGDVGELQPTSGTQHPEDLGERGRLVGHEVQHAVGDHQVGPAVVDREILGQSLPELDVVQPQLLCGLARLGQHLVGHVHPDHLPAGSHEVGGHDRVEPAARPHVDHSVATADRAHRERVRHPGEGLDRPIGQLADQVLVVAEQPRERPTGVEVEGSVGIGRDVAVLVTYRRAQLVRGDRQLLPGLGGCHPVLLVEGFFTHEDERRAVSIATPPERPAM